MLQLPDDSKSDRHHQPLRMFAKRPTAIAGEQHHSLPLHVQNPPVPFLSWSVADSIMENASPSHALIWSTTTSVYRQQASAQQLFDQRDASLDVFKSARLFGNDIEELLESKFAIDTGMDVKQFQSHFNDNVAYVNIFCAIEFRNELERRRVIAHPPSMNEAEQKLYKMLFNSFNARTEFDTASEVRDRGTKFKYAASLDFKKFFQQFELLVKNFWAFIFNKRVYLLTTIPTGACFPPLFAQALSRTMLSCAIRRCGAEGVVESDSCIDNLRMCSDDLGMLSQTWRELLVLCETLGATIGELNPPQTAAPTPYTYLGMLFSVIDDVPRVELAYKSKQKLLRAAEALRTTKRMLVVDLMAIFGQTVWATIVTGTSLGRLYYVIKFMRRIARHRLEESVSVWNCIVELWQSTLVELTTKQFVQPEAPSTTATMYTDASETGWGVVVLNFKDRPIRIFAGAWTEKEAKQSINVLELRALRIGIRKLADTKAASDTVALHGFIDNTTARAWALKRRAPKWSANALTLELHDEMEKAGIQLASLEYVKSADNFADRPSRRHKRLRVN